MRDAGKEVSHKRAVYGYSGVIDKYCIPASLSMIQTVYGFFFLGDEPADYYLSDLFAILSTVIASKPSEKIHVQEGQFYNPL